LLLIVQSIFTSGRDTRSSLWQHAEAGTSNFN